MPDFGWMRLAYLLAVLAVLTALVKLGSPDATSPSATAEPPDWTGAIFPEGRITVDSGGRAILKELRKAARAPVRGKEARLEVRHRRHHETSGVYENVDFKTEPPVFYRPAPPERAASEARGAAPESGTVCRTVGSVPEGGKILFPLSKEHFNSYEDTWGAARAQGGHEGTDLMVPDGTPLYAMTDGRIVPVAGANANGWNTLGGYTVMLEAAYDIGPVKKGDLFYYAHMDGKSAVEIGDTVRAGEVVGYAGDTGEGPEGTRGHFLPHLHLGWYDTSGARSDLASGAMNPFPLLEWVKANGGAVSGDDSNARYCEAPQTGVPTPSTGGSYWSFPSSPGVRPDIDTGSDDPSPSPVVENESRSTEHDPGIEKEPVPKPEVPKPTEKPNGRVDPNEEEPEPDGQRKDAPEADPPAIDPPDVRPDPPAAGDFVSELVRGSDRDRRGLSRRIREFVRDIVGPGPDREPPGNRHDDKPGKPEKKDPDRTPPDRGRPEKPEKTSPEGSPECDGPAGDQYCEGEPPPTEGPPEEDAGAGDKETASEQVEETTDGFGAESTAVESPEATSSEPVEGEVTSEEPISETAPETTVSD